MPTPPPASRPLSDDWSSPQPTRILCPSCRLFSVLCLPTPLARAMAHPARYSPPPTAAGSARGPFGPARIGWLQRTAMVLAGSVLVGLLVTAACLTPSRRGMGTHKQLGLPDCTIVQLFGI